MRGALALILLLAACWSEKRASTAAPPPQNGSGSGSATTSTGPDVYPPAAFQPPTTGLAVGIAAFVVIDDAGKRVFARQGNGIDILDLGSGKKTGRVDLGWAGELWPAAKNLLAMRANGLSIDVALVDPAAAKTIASCGTTVKAPQNAAILRVDEFTTHAGTTYLKWETAPQPQGGGGGMRRTDEEIAAMNAEFQAAYTCGLFAIHTSGSRCTLDVASYKDAGLEACGTRSMPWNRYLPSPIGSLALRVDRSSSMRSGLMIDLETLVISDVSGGERWQLPIETRAMAPPTP